MPYKTVKQDGPDWLPRAVVCRVWDYDRSLAIENIQIVGHDGAYFVDCYNNSWLHAEPIEEWEPVVGQRYVFWDDGDEHIFIGYYSGSIKERFVLSCFGNFDHIARIKNDDGTMVDLDCTVEELKERTEWL